MYCKILKVVEALLKVVVVVADALRAVVLFVKTLYLRLIVVGRGLPWRGRGEGLLRGRCRGVKVWFEIVAELLKIDLGGWSCRDRFAGSGSGDCKPEFGGDVLS